MDPKSSPKRPILSFKGSKFNKRGVWFGRFRFNSNSNI